MKKSDVIGLGGVAIDWFALVDHLPEIDEKVNAIEDYKKLVGGVIANFAVAFARLGGKVGLIGGVGRDEYGKLIVDTLNKENIDISQLKVVNDNTAINIIIVDSKGNRSIVQDRHYITNVPDPSSLNEEYILSARALHTTGVRVDTTEAAMKIAKEHDILVSLDLEKQVVEYGIDKIKPLLKMTDILFPNKLGAYAITKERDPYVMAKKLLQMGPRIVVITLGAEGCLVATENETFKVPAFKVKTVDTTGAGDTFVATFMYSILVKGWDYQKAAIYANAAAALKCTRLGAQSSPTAKEVQVFLKEHGVTL